MINEPHKVLGVSENATQDEIKQAYRKLAKQYHPDLNPDNPDAAKKMNEINVAYDMLTNPEKYASQQAQQSYQGYGSYGYGQQRPYGQQGQYSQGSYGGWQYYEFDLGDIFGFGGQNSQNNQSWSNPQSQSTDHYEIRCAIDAINSKNYSEALKYLSYTPDSERNGRWHYLSALAHHGMGNTVQAVEHIKKAVQMDPGNNVYRQIYNQLTRSAYTYDTTARRYHFDPMGGVQSLCLSLCLTRLCCGPVCWC